MLRQYGLAGVVLATHGGQARIEIIAPIVVGLAAVEPTQSAKAAAPRLVFDDLSYGFVGAPIAGPALDLCLAGAGLALRGGLRDNQTPEAVGILVPSPSWPQETATELVVRLGDVECLRRTGIAELRVGGVGDCVDGKQGENRNDPEEKCAGSDNGGSPPSNGS